MENINVSVELNTILSSAHNGIIAVDKEGYVTILNPSAEKIIGRRAAEVIGKHISDVIPNTNLTEVLQTGESNFSQKLLIGNHTVITNRTPILKNGEIIGAVAVFQDISELETISKELNSGQWKVSLKILIKRGSLNKGFFLFELKLFN